jgi:SAM-dependent methyltransferase
MSSRPSQPQPTSEERIQSWFDRTYATRGRRYLRPVQAYQVFLEILKARPEEHLLDVACGPGHLLASARERGLRMSGIDLSEVAVRLAREAIPGARILQGNAQTLPFADGEFDLLTCLGSLERMTEPRKALQEMVRVGSAEARYGFMVRNARSLGWRLIELLGKQNKAGHQGAGTLEEWRTLLEEAGLRITAVLPDQWPLMWKERLLHRLGRTPRFTRVRAGLLPLPYANEFIFVARKPPPVNK